MPHGPDMIPQGVRIMTKNLRESVILPDQGKILVVDSDHEMIELMRVNFGREGFEIVGCDKADDLYSLDLDDYRIMVIDLGINDGDGLSIIEQVKQTESVASLPIIATSVNLSPTQIITALNAGADDYLLKPYSLRELMARIRSVLRRL